MNSRHALPKKRAPQEHGTWSKKAAPVVCASGSHFACGYAISLRRGVYSETPTIRRVRSASSASPNGPHRAAAKRSHQ